MNIYIRFKEMPRLLAVLVLLGLLSPVLAFLSVLSGNVVGGGEGNYAYGAASNIYELAGVVLLSVPVFVASILVVTAAERRLSICCYLIGFAAICLSPLCLIATYESFANYLIELLMYVVIGSAIGVFLFRSKDVESYFSRKRESSWRI